MTETTSSPRTRSRRFGKRTRGVTICVAAILLSGILHGYLDGRWVDKPNLQRIGAQLAELPSKCGDWELADEGELDERAAEMLQCHGSLVREYWNPASGQRVNVAVLFGPRGPIAVHVPEICYSSRGTEPAGPTTVLTLKTDDQLDQLWRVEFQREGSEEPHLEVCYGWSDGGRWQAAKYPRVWLTDQLYKVQVAGPPGTDGQPSPVQDFLKSFLPALNHQISQNT
ncbi:exosortase-associated EpsI family protein [Stieleria varia]|uniref:Methanolan biosynthesis EpsI domain-containing protein n=1 Tax=Stieleria varia TaxID=2528005 RepID=A0A5C6AP26_9BACT|nr:exosortase-associated EpsI family protein [Stieleria varia]TWU01258.1 hypothetical protein Pla52n_46320 [Stieleria varia]